MSTEPMCIIHFTLSLPFMRVLLLSLLILIPACAPTPTRPRPTDRAPKAALVESDRTTDKTPEIDIIAPGGSPQGSPVRAEILIRNTDTREREFTYYVHVNRTSLRGDHQGRISGPLSEKLTIAPGATATIAHTVPWATIHALGFCECLEFYVVVTRADDQRRWFKQRVVVIDGLPVSVTLTPDSEIRIGDNAAATVICTNPLSTPLNGAVLTLSGGVNLLINGTQTTEEIQLGALAPNSSTTITRSVTAMHAGHHIFAATFIAERAIGGDASASIHVRK